MAKTKLGKATEMTWSIVGVDPDSGEVGVAIASCVPGYGLGSLDKPLKPVVLVPGKGAAVTQAALNTQAASELAAQIEADASAQAAIDAVTNSAFDANAGERQHGVVLLNGEAASFTGEYNQHVALNQTADNVSAQGNILVSESVIADSLAAFQNTDGELAGRLVNALQAGSTAGGDSRCGAQTALFAQVAVAKPGDSREAPSTLLTFVESENSSATDSANNPVTALATAYESGQRNVVQDNGGIPWVLYGIGIAILVVLFLAGAFLFRIARKIFRKATA